MRFLQKSLNPSGKAGIQFFQIVTNSLDSGACPGLDPGFTGAMTFYEILSLADRCPFGNLAIDSPRHGSPMTGIFVMISPPAQKGL